MANIYKNKFYEPTVTTAITVYTCPSNATAIVQNIQLSNTSGSKNVTAKLNDSSASATYSIAYASITGPTICNIAKGPIVLEENDALSLESTTTSGITAVLSILEISREDQNG